MPVTGNNLINHSLSIRITAGGFSFFVTESISGDSVHREDYTKRDDETLSHALGKMLVSSTIQRFVFNKVQVVVDTDITCIPLEEFNADDVDSLYQLVFDKTVAEANKVCCTQLPSIGVVGLFSVPNEVCETVWEVFPEATFTNTCSVVLERSLAFSQMHPETSSPLFVFLQSNKMFVYSIFENQLLFFNTFTLENEQNALYFMLSVWKELKFDPRGNACHIAGDDLMRIAELADSAHEYLLHVDVTNEIGIE